MGRDNGAGTSGTVGGTVLLSSFSTGLLFGNNVLIRFTSAGTAVDDVEGLGGNGLLKYK